MSVLLAKTYTTIDHISTKQWEELNCINNVYFSPNFLRAFEESNPDIVFKYIIISKDNEALSLATIQIISLSVDVILKNIKIGKTLKKVIHSLFCNNALNIMFCGNVFLSGEHGIFLRKGIDKHSLFSAITKEISNLSKSIRPLHAIFVKDFYQESLHITDAILKFGYTSMPVEPNMILTIDPSWETFDDYKNSLKSKYRIKVNKADSTSASLESKLFSENDFAIYKDELQQLYENTIVNADFNAQVLNLDTYIKLRTIFRENFIVKAYFYQDKLVGFLSGLITNGHLDAHFIGLDYTLNKQCAIYPRILNDYTRLGIENGVSQINLGRTASEIKTTIGAKPEQLMCYIRHKRKSVNAVVRPFLKMVKIKDFKHHQPFKKQKEA